MAVEDFPMLRTALVEMLQSIEGIEVVAACADGRTAIELVARARPDILLLDLHLPEVGGMTVLEQVRARHPEVKIVVLSASEQPDRVLAAIAAGASGYLSKRARKEEMLEALRTVQGGGTVVSPHLAGALLARGFGEDGNTQKSATLLSLQELGVLQRVANGLTDTQIAREMFISTRTVQNYLARVREKTGVRRRAELTRWAIEHAWL